MQLAEENCLARAVYFEARSESELGQLAVAKVILNRTKDPDYPKTICGVVYQGSGPPQFLPVLLRLRRPARRCEAAGAWANSKRIAQKAMAGDQVGAASSAPPPTIMPTMSSPKWASSMKRLIKIGRHIFYSDS